MSRASLHRAIVAQNIKNALDNNPPPQLKTMLRAALNVMEKAASLEAEGKSLSDLLEKKATTFSVERRKLDEGERMSKIIEQHMSANAQRRASGILAGAVSGWGTNELLRKHTSLGGGKRTALVSAAVLLGGKAGRNIEDGLITRRLKKLENPDARHFLVKRSFTEQPPFVCAACGFLNNPQNNILLPQLADLGIPPSEGEPLPIPIEAPPSRRSVMSGRKDGGGRDRGRHSGGRNGGGRGGGR